MALQPSLRSLAVIGHPNAVHTMDVFLDYVCPYSATMANKLEDIVRPILKYEQHKVKVIFRPQIQPWHTTSKLTTEAGLAVLRTSPRSFWPFSLALFKNQSDYFNKSSEDLSTHQIREKLAQLASDILPPHAVEEFKTSLSINGPRGYSAVTEDLKYTIKFARQNGIHVSPSVLWDGLFVSDIDSGWEEKDWSKFFAKRLVPQTDVFTSQPQLQYQ